ncbi:MAG: hypothetical protein JJT81_03920 [Rubellimicrobium sp.]|nr:hypothetical protein [Rubellimicrobium sp.]
MDIRHVQLLLASANYYAGAIDGVAGPLTMRGVGIVQRNGGFDWRGWPDARRLIGVGQRILAVQGFEPGPVDGWAGHNTRAALTAWQVRRETGQDWQVTRRPVQASGPQHGPDTAQAAYPSQSAMVPFYGPAGGPEATAGIVALPFAFQLSWNLSQEIRSFRCHRRLAAPLTSIFAETARHYGQARMTALRLHIWGGCFNHRNMRGGSALSTHAWGAAVDLDPERNMLSWGRDRAALAQGDYDAFWRIVETHGATSLGKVADRDWMHLQFARL